MSTPIETIDDPPVTQMTCQAVFPVVLEPMGYTPGQPLEPLPRIRTLEAVMSGPVTLTAVPHYR